jgi:ABC-type Mn2+/Zn2+ transport system ATPase subunit
MIKRFYVNNFRCLENFTLSIDGHTSLLLLGKNGAGKSTVGAALEVFQSVARGVNRLKDLVKPSDFAQGRTSSPMRFEIEVDLFGQVYQYILALELPEKFKELRVLDEQLSLNSVPLYTRKHAQVNLGAGSGFSLDWHLVALPVIQAQSNTDPLGIFRRWLASMLILAPIPALMSSESSGDALWPERDVENFGEWFTGLLLNSPSAYTTISDYLKEVFPDFKSLQNPYVGSESRSLTIQFSSEGKNLFLPFGDLSDGEKCFFVCALVLASSQENKALFCLWDEPDNHLSIAEVRQCMATLRSSFAEGGQLIVVSHNPEAIRSFSNETTFMLYRRSHLEPTQVKRADEFTWSGNFVDALIRGDVEP